MRVLITGGAGFIGANLSHHLEHLGATVTVLDDLSTGRTRNLEGASAELVIGSVLEAELVERLTAEAHAVVHLAARTSVPRSIDDPVTTHDVNATGTQTVLEAARSSGGRHVIVASSSSVYGSNPDLPKRENGLTRPLSPYAVSKLAAESYALAYQTAYGLPTLAFRFFNVFGALQPAGHAYAAVIPSFVDAALRGTTITVHGDGSQSRDFTHVATVCRTIAAALENRVTCVDPINLAHGSRIDLNTLLGHIQARIDQPLMIRNTAPRIGDVPHSQADPTLLRSLFPAVEPIAFEDGLDQTIEWMRHEISLDVIDLDSTAAEPTWT